MGYGNGVCFKIAFYSPKSIHINVFHKPCIHVHKIFTMFKS